MIVNEELQVISYQTTASETPPKYRNVRLEVIKDYERVFDDVALI